MIAGTMAKTESTWWRCAVKKMTTIARILSDGSVVEVLEDGSERPFTASPMRAMTEAEVSAAAAADPDARPMTVAELSSARRVPRTKTLRRALGLTQGRATRSG
jgi:putative transcriptional regulator